jgi:hypothetical protein
MSYLVDGVSLIFLCRKRGGQPDLETFHLLHDVETVEVHMSGKCALPGGRLLSFS